MATGIFPILPTSHASQKETVNERPRKKGAPCRHPPIYRPPAPVSHSPSAQPYVVVQRILYQLCRAGCTEARSALLFSDGLNVLCARKILRKEYQGVFLKS